MLKDYELEFCLDLHKKLKERIKGKVHTTVKDDVLIITFQMGRNEFKAEFDHLSDRLATEGVMTAIIDEVTTAYRKYIENLYFVTETEAK